MRAKARFLTILFAAMAAGCVSWFITGEQPEVLVTNVSPLESTPFEQRLIVELRIRNPNDFDLQVTGLDFRLDVNSQRLARGLGNKAVTIPRLSDAVVSVETSTSTLDVLRQVLGLHQRQELTYRISGVLYHKDGRLPFDNTGVLFEKGDLPGRLNP